MGVHGENAAARSPVLLMQGNNSLPAAAQNE
jgi:hypothetical protein